MDLKRVLVFGGAFNPPTRGHLEGAETALAATGKEGVVFVPSKSVYIKLQQQKDFAFTEDERFQMLRLCASTRPWMRVSRFEISQKQQPLTYRTLCCLRDEGYEPSLLIGSDKLPELEHGWKFIPEIASEFGIVCMGRSDHDPELFIQNDAFLSSLGRRLQVVLTPVSLHGISSTRVREALFEGRLEEAAGLVPAEMREYLLSSFSSHLRNKETR